jgi:hypothetical protein
MSKDNTPKDNDLDKLGRLHPAPRPEASRGEKLMAVGLVVSIVAVGAYLKSKAGNGYTLPRNVPTERVEVQANQNATVIAEEVDPGIEAHPEMLQAVINAIDRGGKARDLFGNPEPEAGTIQDVPVPFIKH